MHGFTKLAQVQSQSESQLFERFPPCGGLVPLTIDRRNLALQPIGEAREKDAVEVCLSSLVCQGRVALDDAQSAIFEDWRKAGELCEEKW